MARRHSGVSSGDGRPLGCACVNDEEMVNEKRENDREKHEERVQLEAAHDFTP
jgi:hypothetical protein